MATPEILRRLQSLRERLKRDEECAPGDDLALGEAIAFIRAKSEEPVYFLKGDAHERTRSSRVNVLQ